MNGCRSIALNYHHHHPLLELLTNDRYFWFTRFEIRRFLPFLPFYRKSKCSKRTIEKSLSLSLFTRKVIETRKQKREKKNALTSAFKGEKRVERDHQRSDRRRGGEEEGRGVDGGDRKRDREREEEGDERRNEYTHDTTQQRPIQTHGPRQKVGIYS